MTEVKPHADILDACCGPRMFWYDKDRQDTIYMDIREGDYAWRDRTWGVHPDVIGDFRHIPFPDNRFALVVFDPPHVTHGSDASIINSKYGRLDRETWKADIKAGLRECLRVCKVGGFVNFKWSETEIALSEVTPLFPCTPLYGQRRDIGRSTYWAVFRKEGGQ